MMLHKVKYKDRGKSRSPSTFTTNSGGNPHFARKMLHSKSTYFYRWGSRLNYVVPGVCGLALLVGGIIAISPFLTDGNHAYAEDELAVQADTMPTVSLTLTQGAASQQTPTNVGEVTYRSNVFRVSGTGMVQYIVTLNTADGDTGDLRGRENPYATVGKVASGTKPSDFRNNTWGYAISDRNNTSVANTDMIYNPVPSGISDTGNRVTIANRGLIATTAQVNDSYKLAFAAKLSGELPSDHYEADVYLSLVASSGAVAEFGFTGGNKTISTMQEMTSEICNNAIVGHTGRLYDTRDGKDYWVTKLADNNCWMTQNLDYDGGGTKQQNLTEWSGSTIAAAYYYNPENGLPTGTRYYYNGPYSRPYSMGTDCSTTIGLSECSQFSTTGTDTHYLVGNYYSWKAANAAGTCPSGWRLPTCGTNGEFEKLMVAYGWSSSANQGGIVNTINNNKGIYGDPLYFVYSGFLANGELDRAGYFGWYWSSTLQPQYNDFSFDFHFDNTITVSDGGTGSHGIGQSVRCVAK